MQKVIICFCAIVAIFLSGLLSGICVTKRDADQRIATINTEYAKYIEAQRSEVERLKSSLGSAQTRIESARNGIATALGIAGRESDRIKRIAVLVNAISNALDELGSD